MNIPHCLPPRSYLSVFPNSQTTSFANLFYFCVVKGGLAADTPFESDDNQFCQPLMTLQSHRCIGRRFYRLVGSSGLEPPTSRLSGGCSNQLSYKPML